MYACACILYRDAKFSWVKSVTFLWLFSHILSLFVCMMCRAMCRFIIIFSFFGVCIKIVFDNLPVVISNWPAATNLLILIFYTHRPWSPPPHSLVHTIKNVRVVTIFIAATHQKEWFYHPNFLSRSGGMRTIAFLASSCRVRFFPYLWTQWSFFKN